MRRSSRAHPDACLPVASNVSRASRLTVLRSTARFRTRRGTDMRRTGTSGTSAGRLCNPKHAVDATGRVLRRTLALTRRATSGRGAVWDARFRPDASPADVFPPDASPADVFPPDASPANVFPPDASWLRCASPGFRTVCCLDTETLAAFGTPGPDHRPTAASFHAHKKSVRALAASH